METRTILKDSMGDKYVVESESGKFVGFLHVKREAKCPKCDGSGVLREEDKNEKELKQELALISKSRGIKVRLKTK